MKKKWNEGIQLRELESTDEIELPEIVYKYRDWENKYHKPIITDSVLYFSSPRDFEDPKDCKNLVDYSLLTDDDIFNKYYKRSKEANPFAPEIVHRQFAQSWFDRGLLRDKKHIQETTDHFENIFFDCFGVLSLTENFKSPSMWKKYANNRKGFCIGYETRCFVSSNHHLGGGTIMYVDELPRIHPNEQDISSYMTQIYTKENKWSFEQEFRIHRRWANPVETKNRLIPIPAECVREIIFGAEMPDEYRKEIKKIAKEKYPNVKFKKMIKRTR